MEPRGPTRKRTSAAKTSTCFEPDGLLQAQVSLQLHHDHRSPLLPGCDTGRSFNGSLQGRLRRPRAHVASIDGPRHLTRSGRSHYAAHPYNSGRCHRLGLPAFLGWPQSRDPAPRRDGRHRPWLSARISSIRRCCRTRRRRDLNCIRDASACGRTKRHARADEGGRDVGIVLGSRLRVHQHDRPRRWTALPSLRPAPTARPRRLRRDWRGSVCSRRRGGHAPHCMAPRRWMPMAEVARLSSGNRRHRDRGALSRRSR